MVKKLDAISEELIDMLFNKKLKYEEIKQIIHEKYGIDVSLGTITNFKKYILTSSGELIENSPELKKKMTDKLLDTLDNLVYTLDQIKEKIEQFEHAEDWKAHLGYIRAMLDLIDKLMRRAGEYKSIQNIVNVQKANINILEINKAVQNRIIEFIDSGDIDINHVSPRIKELYNRLKSNPNVEIVEK